MYEVAFKVSFFEVLWIAVRKFKVTKFELSGIEVLLMFSSLSLCLKGLLCPLRLCRAICSGCAGRCRTLAVQGAANVNAS